ncbi:ATP-binding domain-containing protein [Propionivibrio soli]|uniref:ATP-binding domain-containing protein n=1 Tax=Propionivibrio soli TaxID=2976531 RepID=UPI0021E94027|nr:ATP-binding domain-containing protein [Propionivibrio soli]
MAHVIPTGWRELTALGAAQRELETLTVLANGLPDDYTIYHGLHWTRVHQGTAFFGEIDFVVVSPSGRLLLIEQKSGFLAETADGLCKAYGAKEKSVPIQMSRSMHALQTRLDQSCPNPSFHLDALLYCPDYTVRQPGSAGIDPERIVDATRREHLVAVVKSILPLGAQAHPAIDKLHRFLADELELVPEVTAVAGQAGTLYTRLSGGLTHWARHIECDPFRLRVIGTAGSGKTQLALAVLRDAVVAGRRPLYVCYNRPLADHMALIAPSGGIVATYHQLADRIYRGAGHVPDFSQPGAFAQLEDFLSGFQPDESWLFDEIIVDEGQDFQEAWKDNVLRLLRPSGRAWWLEDPTQNLYGRQPVRLPGWVVVRSETNYRSPQDILVQLNQLMGNMHRFEAGSPLTGSGVEILVYKDAPDLLKQTKRAITAGLSAGFRREMIALVTFRGREHSLLAPYDHLGPYPLKIFTGQYDLLGNPVFTSGDIASESIYRFKGQAAPCVIFTEVDFEVLGEKECRKLFVGMTRATMKLILVVSERAGTAIGGPRAPSQERS